MNIDKELDTRGLNCPLPILKAKKALAEMTTGQLLKVVGLQSREVGTRPGREIAESR